MIRVHEGRKYVIHGGVTFDLGEFGNFDAHEVTFLDETHGRFKGTYLPIGDERQPDRYLRVTFADEINDRTLAEVLELDWEDWRLED
ncbi:MAG: hypothetical protein QHH05_08865 [Syntrophomonadaceae bacterium]|nr:hypothetical protein [Syntrophomonadaceae bacterium]